MLLPLKVHSQAIIVIIITVLLQPMNIYMYTSFQQHVVDKLREFKWISTIYAFYKEDNIIAWASLNMPLMIFH